jgi:hypothetical protein
MRRARRGCLGVFSFVLIASSCGGSSSELQAAAPAGPSNGPAVGASERSWPIAGFFSTVGLPDDELDALVDASVEQCLVVAGFTITSDGVETGTKPDDLVAWSVTETACRQDAFDDLSPWNALIRDEVLGERFQSLQRQIASDPRSAQADAEIADCVDSGRSPSQCRSSTDGMAWLIAAPLEEKFVEENLDALREVRQKVAAAQEQAAVITLLADE